MQIDINSRKQLNKPENYAVFYSLLNRLPTSDRDALKESVVAQYTDGRTTSLRDMTLKEYSAAIAGMRKLVPPTHQEELRKILRQKRSAVLHQMQLLGINTADWDKVNAFCLFIMLSTSTTGACSYALSIKSHAAISVSSRSPQSLYFLYMSLI